MYIAPIHDINQQKGTDFFTYLCCNTKLNIGICFDPQGAIVKK